MADIHVTHTGSNTSPYETEAKASTDIQVALDAAGAGDTIHIKKDADYVMDGIDQQAAQFDIDVNDNVKVKGYFSTLGDQDFGGAYYKDPTNGWAVIDGNSGAFNILSVGDFEGISIEDLKCIGVGTDKAAFDLTPTGGEVNYFVQNCNFVGNTNDRYAIVMNFLINPIIRDCDFSGSWETIPAVFGIVSIQSAVDKACVIEDCRFSVTNITRAIYAQNAGLAIIRNNIFASTGNVSKMVSVSNAALFNNNIIYEKSGVITTGLDISIASRSMEIFNNIIVGCTTSILDAPSVGYFGGWNCFYNNGTDWTFRQGDIQADPQFADAANGDFRLLPTSPCLHAGKDGMSIGMEQRKQYPLLQKMDGVL